jgi:hypothetical protein
MYYVYWILEILEKMLQRIHILTEGNKYFVLIKKTMSDSSGAHHPLWNSRHPVIILASGAEQDHNAT